MAAPTHAVEFFDYGFTQVDNSAGGSVLDGYVSQQLWTNTELLLMGAQLRIELESGSLFQDTFLGSGFSFGGPHEVLAAEQPSLAFDTHVGINGAQPGVIAGGAVNLGGEAGVVFDDKRINAAWSSGPGNLASGRFDLGMITLSGDAIGRGAILLSGDERGRDGRKENFAHVFEIEAGVIRFANEPILSYDGTHVMLDRNFESMESVPLPDREPPGPAVDLSPPVFDPDPIIEPDLVPPLAEPPVPIEPGGQPESSDENPILYPITHYIPDFDLEDLDFVLDDAAIDIRYFDMLQLPTDAILLWDEIATAGGEGDVTLDENDLMVLRALDGTQALLLTASYGELAVPLSSLTEAAVADLVSTGNWSVRGANLIFGAGGGVPEPSSVVLAATLIAGVLGWRWRRITASPRR